MNLTKNEPVLAAITTLLAAGGGLIAAFGVHLTEIQVAAIAQFVQDAYIVGFLVRAQVTPRARMPRTGSPATGTGNVTTRIVQP